MKYIFGKNLRHSEYSSVDGGYCVYSVYGEDPNCDMGGYHSNPFLGNVEGTFKDVLEYAANNMKGFYQWGSGGYITPKKELKESVEPIVLDKAKRIKKLRKDKLNHIVVFDIDTLIESIDNMSNEEIKKELNDIKNKIINK